MNREDDDEEILEQDSNTRELPIREHLYRRSLSEQRRDEKTLSEQQRDEKTDHIVNTSTPADDAKRSQPEILPHNATNVSIAKRTRERETELRASERERQSSESARERESQTNAGL